MLQQVNLVCKTNIHGSSRLSIKQGPASKQREAHVKAVFT